MSWVDDFNSAVGSVSKVIQEGAEVYDKISGKPSTSTGPITAASEPAQTVGVDTTQGTAAPGFGLRLSPLAVLVGVLVLLALVGRA